MRRHRHVTTCLGISALPLCLLLAATGSGRADDFSVDRASPEPPGHSPAEIYDQSGAGVLVTAAGLGVGVADDIDAFSYGEDQLEPAGGNFYVSIIYSISPQTVGGPGFGPGGGAVRAQVAGNGAAADKFYLKAVWAGPVILALPISRGLVSDGPMHNLPDPAADIDGLSRPAGKVDGAIYFSIDERGAVGRSWHPADILVVEPGGTAQVWARFAQLGLDPGDNIDALAIANGGDPALDAGDIVYVSLKDGSPTRNSITQGDEAVYQVFPGSVTPVFSAANLNLSDDNTEELDAMTGFDPGFFPDGPPPHGDPPPQQQQQQQTQTETPRKGS